jgi:hypothetical protein
MNTDDIWKKRFLWLIEQHWVQPEAEFRLSLESTDYLQIYVQQVIAAIDLRLENS